MLIKSLAMGGVIIATLAGCNSERMNVPTEEEPPVVVEPEPVIDYTDADEQALQLETVKTHITTSEGRSYFVDLPEDSETLVISLFSGEANEDLGDPDVYVKFGEEATAGEAGVFDCVSYNGSGYNETCIIDKPLAGRYHIFVDAYEGSMTQDASMFATTELFPTNMLCEDSIRIRAQAMTQEELEQACTVLANTKSVFDTVLSDQITPDFQQAVPDDLNEITNLHIFSSLSNHASWAEHLFDTSNTSGIYFETSPTEWWHSSDILTFNAIEWSGGRSVIRSLAHEYVHALDGRYNKEGGYNGSVGWWSEGLAEYLSTFYQLPYTRVSTASADEPYTLSEIFAGDANIYSWGQLAVAFLIEEHPEVVNQMLVHMRAGEWEDFTAYLADVASDNQAEFASWSTTKLTEQYLESAVTLELDSYNHINGRGGWLFEVDVPSGQDSVSFITTGGSGNVDMWVRGDNPFHPELEVDFTCSSITDGSNEERCDLDSPAAGKYYVAISSDFIGADIVDLYLSACTGENCEVNLPEPMPLTTAVEPYLPHWPEKGEIGTCSLAETYRRSNTGAESVTITNPTDKLVNVFWLNNSSAEKAGSSYATLSNGESFTAEGWRVGERMMLTDGAENCLGVAILNDTNNAFEVTEEMVENAEDVAAPVELPEATAFMGSCDLAVPYTRSSGNAPDLLVANQFDSQVKLYWINDGTGEPLLSSVYATLEQGDTYQETFWAIGDRMMVTDENDTCIGVLDLNGDSNIFILE